MSADAIKFLQKQHQLWINDKWADSNSTQSIDVVDPSTGDVILSLCDADKSDLDSCVTAARNAFESDGWSGLNPVERAQLMRRFADLIELNLEELAYLETVDSAQPLALAKTVDIIGSAMGIFFNSSRGYDELCTNQSRCRQP